MSAKTGVGVIGARTISVEYLRTLTAAPGVTVESIADLDVGLARRRADEFGVRHAGSVDELLAIDEISIVLNLTTPRAHADVSERILAAGKHVWSEKPLAVDEADARELLARAGRAGLRVGCAPDTLLGPGFQRALRLVQEGAIGTPIAATAVMVSAGPDRWHPAPEFLFSAGAGPMMDFGPYYLSALVSLLGPAEAVAAASSTPRRTRTVMSGPRAGTSFPVTVPTTTTMLLRFRDASATAIFSFDSARRRGELELIGTAGVLTLPDPAYFDGAGLLWQHGSAEPIELSADGPLLARGVGVLDLVDAIHDGRPERASGELAAHIVAIMQAAQHGAESGTAQQIGDSPALLRDARRGWGAAS